MIFYSSNGNSKLWQVWNWFEAARGDRFFTILKIPSQVEIDNLARKVLTLEKKLKVVTKHKKRAA